MTQFIANIGGNHNQDLNRTLDLVRVTQEMGCWGVKLQIYNSEQMYRNASKELIADMKQSEFPLEYLYTVKKYCRLKGINLGFTVFHPDMVDKICSFADFYKIGSYELSCIPLVERILKEDKRTYLGMQVPFDASFSSYCPPNWLIYGCLPTLLANECDLGGIGIIQANFPNATYGWKDHTVMPGVIYKAIALGMSVIEFQLDMEDKLGNDFLYGHCWIPSKMRKVIENIAVGEICLETWEEQPKEIISRRDSSDFKCGIISLEEIEIEPVLE